MPNYTGLQFSIPRVPTLSPAEIRHLRSQLGWSQGRLGHFLSRDAATVSRWESGRYEPEEWAAGVLYKLWTDVFGSYDGPYADLEQTEVTFSKSSTTDLGKTLLKLGVIGFIAFGAELLGGDDE